MTNFSSEQNTALSAVRIVGSTFSMIGSGFIIIMYLRFSDLRKFAFKLIVMVSLCDLILGFGIYLGDGNVDNTLCRFQAFIIQFGSIGEVLWTAVIAYSIREVVLVQPRNTRIEDNMNTYHMFVWGTSLVSCILPMTTNNYGDADGWCWISKYGNHGYTFGTFWRMFCFYIPLWVTIFFIIVVYRRTLRVLDRSAENFKRMRWYPMVLIVIYFFATVDRVWQLFAPANYELCVFRVFFASLAGFFNAIIYGWTPAVQDKVRTCLHNNGLINYEKLNPTDLDPYVGKSEPLLTISDGIGIGDGIDFSGSLDEQNFQFAPLPREPNDVFINNLESSQDT